MNPTPRSTTLNNSIHAMPSAILPPTERERLMRTLRMLVAAPIAGAIERFW
jgi:hypothetical protein